MRISYKQLKKLPVVTSSGTELGAVHDIILDVETQQIVQYVISSSLFSSGSPQLIHQDQVISITSEQMTVRDGSIPHDQNKKTVLKSAPGIEPVVMRNASAE